MKALIIIGCIVAYFLLGLVTTYFYYLWQRDNSSDDDLLIMGGMLFWPILWVVAIFLLIFVAIPKAIIDKFLKDGWL